MVLSKSKISLYSSLSQGKFRKRHGMFAAEGSKCVVDTYEDFEMEAIIATPGWISGHPEICCSTENVYEESRDVIRKISSLSTPSEVIAIYRIPGDPDRQNEIPLLEKGRLYLLLDGVQDPGNMGTIIRTAHWFGIKDIFASNDSADIYNPKTVQSTMGSLGKVKVIRADLEALIDQNPELPVYGLLLEGESIYNSSLGSEGLIVMGNEGNGLSSGMREKVTNPLTIPPHNPGDHGESLNVATATAATLALFRRGE